MTSGEDPQSRERNVPTLYLDLGSPYAYLAAERVESVLGCFVEFQPVLLGAIFQRRGWGSWAATAERAAGMAEVERRAHRYGLAPIVWPPDWPLNALAADRAAIWAQQQGVAEPFVRAVFRREFAAGEDISRPSVLRAAAEAVGLDPEELLEAIRGPAVKEALRQATEAAWSAGVIGVPSLGRGSAILFGDDRLEEAAQC